MIKPCSVFVVMPCLYHGELLREAVAGVTATRREDVELIVVDDRSRNLNFSRYDDVTYLGTDGERAGRKPSLKLSVAVITHNHEACIREAIKSFRAQQVNFDSGIVVAQDCSTNGTRTVLADLCQRYPNHTVHEFQKHWHLAVHYPAASNTHYAVIAGKRIGQTF